MVRLTTAASNVEVDFGIEERNNKRRDRKDRKTH
jgi:hypothetical protein